MGSWAAPAFSDPKNPVADSLVVKRFPGVGNGHDKDMLGGTGDGYMVSSGTEHKEEAVWVVERFTKLLCEVMDLYSRFGMLRRLLGYGTCVH